MNFASDNTAGIAPAILNAIIAANAEAAMPAYGNDAITARVEKRLADLFEHEAAVFIVPTGTAANALALAHVSPPWGAVLCHAESHIAIDECGAPEFFGGGLKLVGLPGEAGRISAVTLSETLVRGQWGGPHHVTPAVLSLAQSTEAGTVYPVEHLRALCATAHAHGLTVHMDGARLANAVASLGVTPAETTWKAGIDVLSLGATKGGALAAEAIVFFDPERAAGMAERRKRAGHLISKHRFAAAQLDAYFADGCWLALAHHANAMAQRLVQGLAAAAIAPVWPVEANEVFVRLPREADARLRAAGAQYYPWTSAFLPATPGGDGDGVLARLVTSFATHAAEIERFCEIAYGR